MRLAVTAVRLAAGMAAAVDAYLLVLLAAAGGRRPAGSATAPATPGLRFVVLVPAHDEASGIAATVATLRAQQAPPDAVDVVVVADNCTDETAAVARGAGARVWVRDDPQLRGKGQALRWALDRLAQDPAWEALAIVDADCLASPNMLAVMGERLASGSDAVQVDYRVADPDRAPSVALRAAAFSLVNTVRPMGKTALGLSAGLLGTGMAFSRATLEAVPWASFSIVEDAEQHARLVGAGRRVVFDGRAEVASAMPGSLRASTEQQLRWEGGKAVTARLTARSLLRDGLRRRDPVRLHAGLEWLVPPQALLLAGHAGVLAGARLLGSRGAWRLALAGAMGQTAFVLGGLRLVRAPLSVYRALALAPALVAQKLLIYARLAVRGGPQEWVRTEREDAAVSDGAAAGATAPRP